MPQAFSIQSLLRVAPAPTLKEALDNISRARKIATPNGDFIVITAQPQVRALHRQLRITLTEHYPRIQAIHILDEIDPHYRLPALIQELGITEYTDTHEGTLRAISISLGASVKLYLSRDGIRTPIRPATR